MSPEEQTNIFNFAYDNIEERCDDDVKRIRDVIICFYDQKQNNEDIFGGFNENDKLNMMSYLCKALIKNTSAYYIELFKDFQKATNISIKIYYEFQHWCYFADMADYIPIVKIVMEIERFNQDLKNISQKLQKYRSLMTTVIDEHNEHHYQTSELRRIIEKLHLLREIQ